MVEYPKYGNHRSREASSIGRSLGKEGVVLVWQGLGLFAFAIPFLMVVVAYLGVYAIFGAETAARFGTATSGVAILISAGILWRMAKQLAARPGRDMIDKATGEEITLREHHTMFFVPLKYWGMLYGVLGVVVLVAGMLQATGYLPR